jgi:hypothetical protein
MGGLGNGFAGLYVPHPGQRGLRVNKDSSTYA